jgi:hypothetical protein
MGGGGDSSSYANKLLDYMKDGEFLDKVNYYQILEKTSASWS